MLPEVMKVIKTKEYALIFSLLFTAIFILYFYLLANSATGLIYFKGYYLYFDLVSAITISTLVGLVVTLNIYSYRINVKTSKKFSIGSIIGAILPSSLCCTSIIPAFMAVLGFSTPFIVGNTGKIQSIFAVYGPVFIAAGAAIAFFGLIQITGRISSGCCVKPKVEEECCEVKNEVKD
jgi:hypothetical protein